MSYIESSDITDSVAKRFVDNSDARVSSWLDESDGEVNAEAERRGIDRDDIVTADTGDDTALHPTIKAFAKAVFCYACFRDNVGATNIEVPENEKYAVKMRQYFDEVSLWRSRLTREMFTDQGGELSGAAMVRSSKWWRA